MDDIEAFKRHLFEWGKAKILEEESAGFPNASKFFNYRVLWDTLGLQHEDKKIRYFFLLREWKASLSSLGIILAKPSFGEKATKALDTVYQRVKSYPLKQLGMISPEGQKLWVPSERGREFSAKGWRVLRCRHRRYDDCPYEQGGPSWTRQHPRMPVELAKPHWRSSEFRKLLRPHLPALLGKRLQADGGDCIYVLKRGGIHLYTNMDIGGTSMLRMGFIGIELIQDGRKILEANGHPDGMPPGAWLGYSTGRGGMNIPLAVSVEQVVERIAYWVNTFVDGITQSLERAGVKVEP